MTDPDRTAGAAARPAADDARAAALAEAADAARLAPSIHNTQPWHWRVHGPTMDLRADRRRQLLAADPDCRLLVLSCGAALHHARIALAAEGWPATVRRLPDRDDADLLAQVSIGRRGEVEPAAMRLFQTVRVRHTDRRPVVDEPVEPAALLKVADAAGAEGTRMHLLRPEDVVELAAAVAQAEAAEATDHQQRVELAQWVGGEREGSGVPDAAIPAQQPQTWVPERDFGRAGGLPVGPGHDTAARYAVLYGDGDAPLDWLRAGEALSALWLVAIEHGLSVLPYSAPIEVVSTRQRLRRMLSEIGYPYLVVRLGATDPEHAGPPHPPRLPAAEVIEIAEPD
jgi:nitroreductase